MDLLTTLTSSTRTRSMILTLTSSSLSILTSSARLWQLSPTVLFPSSLLQSSVASREVYRWIRSGTCTSAHLQLQHSLYKYTRQDISSFDFEFWKTSTSIHRLKILSSCFGDLALLVHQTMLSYWPRITIWHYSGENFPCIKCHQLIATLTYALRIIPPCWSSVMRCWYDQYHRLCCIDDYWGVFAQSDQACPLLSSRCFDYWNCARRLFGRHHRCLSWKYSTSPNLLDMGSCSIQLHSDRVLQIIYVLLHDLVSYETAATDNGKSYSILLALSTRKTVIGVICWRLWWHSTSTGSCRQVTFTCVQHSRCIHYDGLYFQLAPTTASTLGRAALIFAMFSDGSNNNSFNSETSLQLISCLRCLYTVLTMQYSVLTMHTLLIQSWLDASRWRRNTCQCMCDVSITIRLLENINVMFHMGHRLFFITSLIAD